MAASGAAVAAALAISCSSQGMIDENLEVEDSGSGSVSQDSTPAADAVPATTTKRKGGNRRGVSAAKVVEIPQQAIERNGAILNAYYFVRGEGSWVDLAQRIYRDPVRAEDLKSWNPETKITTGSVVFYKSPTRSGDDTMMKAFHDDFGVPAESYSFQAGDTLGKIAEAKLGSKEFVAEIKAANPGVDFAQVAAGTMIAVPPLDVNNAQILEQLAQNQLEGQRQNRQASDIERATEAARSNPGTAGTEANVAGTTSSENPSQRAPASEDGPASRLMGAMQGLPVPPQVLAGALAILIGGAFLLRRRAE
jgi:LysM repeat protein